MKKKINKVLLCGAGNCIQYLAIAYNGKESEKDYVYLKHFVYTWNQHNNIKCLHVSVHAVTSSSLQPQGTR